MHSTFSLVLRAWLALFLMIGFYALALGLVAGLLWIPYAEVAYAHRIHFKILIFCLIGAGVILWSILPRWEKFTAPGARLNAQQHPRLFAILNTVAKATGQSMPSEVYLLPEMNAFVSSRGGVMGFLSRRIMGLGAPLLQVLSVSEFKAVIAHEFGHYVGGDVGLGPWVYKTRAAIGRTLANLEGQSSALHFIFNLYGALFLRVTLAISRHQEFAADRLSARVVGAKPLADGLRKTEGAAAAYQAYWQNEVEPVLGNRFQPRLTEGFKRFIGVERIAKAMEESTREAEQNAETDPYDSHPGLKQRVEALKGLPDYQAQSQDWPAIELLEKPEAYEREMMGVLLADESAKGWPFVSWEDVGSQVYLPFYRETTRKHFNQFAPLTVDSVSEVVGRLEDFGRNFIEPGMENAGPEQLKSLGGARLAAAVCAALARDGWAVTAPPGEAVQLRKENLAFSPFAEIKDLTDGKKTGADWQTLCREMGIAGTPLKLE